MSEGVKERVKEKEASEGEGGNERKCMYLLVIFLPPSSSSPSPSSSSPSPSSIPVGALPAEEDHLLCLRSH